MLDLFETFLIYLYLGLLLGIFIFAFRKKGFLQVVAMLFVSISLLPLPDDSSLTSQVESTPEIIIVSAQKSFGDIGQTALRVCGGDSFTQPSPPNTGVTPGGAGDRGSDRLEDYDPSPRNPSGGSGSGSSSTSLSMSKLDKNKVPPKEDWSIDGWCDEDEFGSDDSHDQKLDMDSDPLPVPVNFEHVMDSNNNPTLLVPNIDVTRLKRGQTFTRIEYDQTATHLHHIPELGIELPPGFDLQKYKNMNNKDRIAYAKEHVPQETIISYQNAIGLSMTPQFGTGLTTKSFRGIAGVYKQDISVVAQTIPNNTKEIRLSVVRDNGVHVSTYTMKTTKFKKLMEDPEGFWLFKTRPF